MLSFQSYTLTGLNTYTQYLVSLKAYNPDGDGPETIVVVMTDEGGKWILFFSVKIPGRKLTGNRKSSGEESRPFFIITAIKEVN